MVVSAYQGSFPDADAIPRHHGAIEHAGAVSAVRRADIHPSPVPQALEAVHAGFPSVAQDYFNGDFSLDEHIINHPDTTFVVTVAGDSMMNAGIWDGDLLVVDRALDPQDGDVVIAVLDDELTVKRLVLRGRTPILHPENPAHVGSKQRPRLKFRTRTSQPTIRPYACRYRMRRRHQRRRPGK